MSKRPAYLKNKSGTYWLMFAFLGTIIGLVYAYSHSRNLQYLIDYSEFKGRIFQGKTEEIIAPKSGIKVYFMSETSNPLVSVSFIFDGRGTAYDKPENEGLANLAAMTMTAGAGYKSAEALRDELAFRGIKIGFSADKDSFSGQISLPKKYLSEASIYLRDILLKPQFDGRYVDNAKAQILKALETEKENPARELSLEFNKKIYGDHPYGRNSLGTAKTVAAIGSRDLRKFVKQNLGQNRLYIGVAGDISQEEVENFVDDVFGALPKKTEVEDLLRPQINWKQHVLIIKRDGGQNIVSFAAKGTCRQCEDFYPLYIANYLFGGSGLNSRLNQKIREQEGLTYGAYSSLVLRDKSDLLMAGFSSTQDKFAKALKLFAYEWAKIAQKGFVEEDLQTAKNYLTASYNLRFSSISGIAEMLAYMQKYDLGLDFLQKRNSYVEAVTLSQLNKVAKRYFSVKPLQAEIGLFERGEN